jgi:hypothetical protein
MFIINLPNAIPLQDAHQAFIAVKHVHKRRIIPFFFGFPFV